MKIHNKHHKNIGFKLITGLLLASLGNLAQADPNYPITGQQRATADAVAQAGVPLSALAANAPDSYAVVPGDTLWHISSLFLTDPWRWPELWGMNRDQIRNPHLIYPGQILYLDKSNGQARLRVGKGFGSPGGTVKLSPSIRIDSIEKAAIPSIPANLIEPFLSEPLIVEPAQLEKMPRIVALTEGRVYLGKGDKAYIRGELDPSTEEYQIFRPATPLRDPDTKAIIAYEAVFLGTARVTRDAKGENGAATIVATSSKMEMGVGDRLIPGRQRDLLTYAPSAPVKEIEGRVVSIYGGGVAEAGQNMVVTINRGRQQGVELGNVVALHRYGKTIVDRTETVREKKMVRLPDERYGLLFIFRTFENLSYGLVMNVSEPVQVGDKITQP